MEDRSATTPHRVSVRMGQAIAVLWTCLAHSGELVVGEWTDSLGTIWSQEITIVESDGALYRRSTDTGGGDWSRRLKEMRPKGTEQRRFAYFETCCHEQFAITASGDLNLYDEEGFIRTARKKSGSTASATRGAAPRGAAKSDSILERDAIVSDSVTDPETLAGLFAIVIGAYEFRCDTVSGITKQFFADKWNVSCNGFRYSYVVYDRGGTWVAEYND